MSSWRSRRMELLASAGWAVVCSYLFASSLELVKSSRTESKIQMHVFSYIFYLILVWSIHVCCKAAFIPQLTPLSSASSHQLESDRSIVPPTNTPNKKITTPKNISQEDKAIPPDWVVLKSRLIGIFVALRIVREW